MPLSKFRMDKGVRGRELLASCLPRGVDWLRIIWAISGTTSRRIFAVKFVVVVFGERVVGRQSTADGSQTRQRLAKQLRVVVLQMKSTCRGNPCYYVQ